MRKIPFITAVVLAAAPTAFAALGDVLGSFSSPTAPDHTRGLARSESYLFVLDTMYDRVFVCSPTTGAVYSSWQLPTAGLYAGLAYSWGGNLWAGNYSFNRVYRVDSVTGSVKAFWSAGGSDAYGLAPLASGDGGAGTTAIFSSDASPSYCWRHNLTTGSVISSFNLPNVSGYDIAWDFRNRLLWMGDAPNIVYGYTTTGSVVASFTVPGDSPYGIAYDNRTLWVGCAGPSPDTIYRLDCPSDVGVRPLSLGRVKALLK